VKPATLTIRVWDLPTRIFHWLVAVLVVFSLVTGKIGGSWLEWHMRSGYAILTLVLFRLAWGIVGSETSRFASFLRGPAAFFRYAGDIVGRRHRAVIPCFAVEDEAIDYRSSCSVDAELRVHVVVRVVRRVCHLQSFPPLAGDYLVVFVFTGLQLEEIRVHCRENSDSARACATNHVADTLSALEMIECACASNLQVCPPQIYANQIHCPRTARIGELSI